MTVAIEKGNVEIVDLLLNYQNIDINIKLISFDVLFNLVFECFYIYSISKIIYINEIKSKTFTKFCV